MHAHYRMVHAHKNVDNEGSDSVGRTTRGTHTIFLFMVRGGAPNNPNNDETNNSGSTYEYVL